MNIGLITLGCSKNQVDSEMLLGYFRKKDMQIVTAMDLADIIVINTCGFIDSAKQEAIDTILEMADYKNEKFGKCSCLIVTGCLAKRYKDDIYREIPEVDLVLGVDEYKNINKIIDDFFKKKNFISKLIDENLEYKNRIISTVFPMAYLRISDGCDNRCSYCAIPLIRGEFVSRKIEDIVEEAKLLASKGIKELNIISQDTSRYGLDLYGTSKLAELLNQLSKIEEIKWIRVLYQYPSEITDEIIEAIASNEKVCNYFDIPVQHLSDKMLVSMNRRGSSKDINDVITKIRNRIPDAIIRTTLIVGFPGETVTDYNILKEGIKKIKFERLGCFQYSREEGTTSYDFENQVDFSIAEKREKEIMESQMIISYNFNKTLISKKIEVLVEGVSEDENYFVCRSYMDAPDVDGRIYIKISDVKNLDKIIIGEFYYVEVIDATPYDLYAKFL